jgi:hypothetical protein
MERSTELPTPDLRAEMGIRAKFFLVGLLVLGLASVAAPGSASAAHFYLQHESFEEFKKITSTVEAHVESNTALEWHFPRGSKIVTVACHSKAVEQLYTNGTDKLEHFEVDTCVSGKCLVTPWVGPRARETVLGESGSPVVYTDKVVPFTIVIFELEGVACENPGEYAFWTNGSDLCRATVDNTVDLELVFPVVTFAETAEGCHASQFGAATMTGRVRVTPFEGRALKVGP